MAGVAFGKRVLRTESIVSEDIMDELFSCTICFLPFNEAENLPKLLGCHHTFCRKCLYQLLEHSESLRCPVCSAECRLERNSIDSLSTNYYLYKFTEVLKNLKITDEGAQSLSLFSKGSEMSLDTCLQHGNTEKYFWCSTCSETVCIHCLGINHSAIKDHKVTDLKKAIEDLRSNVIEKVEAIKFRMSNIDYIKSQVNSSPPAVSKVSNALKNIFQAPSRNCENALKSQTDIDKTISAVNNCCFSETFQHDPHALIAMRNQMEELLLYYISIDEFYEQKYKEFGLLQDSRVFVSVIKPNIKFDYGRIYCIRCGELCVTRSPVEVGKENPCNTKFIGNYCKTCGIVMMEFS